MATAGLKVILDDNASDFKYSGGDWTLSTLVQWYSETSNYPAFATDTVFGSFTLEFEGTSIAFIGNTPTDTFSRSQFAAVSIDGGTAYTIRYGNPAPPAYIQWYQSPTLSDGKHTITVSRLLGTAVDMALISVGPNTSLQGKTLIVDDDNSAIQYSGTWTSNANPFNAGTLPDGYPVGNSTHRSTTPGDTFTFRFTGTSVSVYGIFSWAQLGNFSANYTLDGTSIPKTYSVTTSSPQYDAGDGEAANYVLFSSDALAGGNHTLIVNITQCVNQVFMLDYITYTPSFSTLASMPNLTTSSPPTTTFTPGSSPSSAPTSSVFANGSQVSQSKAETKEVPIGAIVGGVVGGVVIFLLIGFFLFYLRRRRSSDAGRLGPPGTQNDDVNYADSESRAMEQVSTLPTSRGTVSPFPNVGPSGYTSVADAKRKGMGSSNRFTTPSPFSNEPRSDGSSVNTSHPSSAPESQNAVASTDLLYHQDSVPPAYDALSSHQHSSLPSQ